MIEKNRRSHGREAALIVALAVASFASSGCSKKKEECAAVEPLAASVRPNLGVSVADDKQAGAKAGALAALLDSATSTRAALEKTTATDKGVRAKSASYSQSLGELVTKATALKAIFEDLAKAADAVAALAGADKALKKAGFDFRAASDVADLTKFAHQAEGLDGSASSLNFQADQLLRAKWSDEKATAAAVVYAKAMRDKAAVLKDGKDLDAKLKELEEKSASARDAFATARTSVQKADSALTETCSATK